MTVQSHYQNKEYKAVCNNDVVLQLIRLARENFPKEVCGFVLNHDEVIEVNNVASYPKYAFVMDKGELDSKVAPRYGEITAIWHSHPGGSTMPSPGDLHTMKVPGCINPLWEYWIVTATGVFNWPLS